MSIAWVFPGQGSQKVGMAETLLSLPNAVERFETASKLIGRDLLAICNGKGPENSPLDELNQTINTQPGLFLVESLLVDDLKKQGRKASLVAGHSLGELVALYAAEVFDWDTGLKLMIQRSELMSKAKNGTMTAVLGFDRPQLEDLIKDTQDVVIANDNSEFQVVLSGQPESIKKIVNQITCKRAIQLPVSGAFHSPLMNEAAELFSSELDNIQFNEAIFPVISNTDPTPTSNGNLLKERLKQQMTTGVRWRETMDTLASKGIKTVVEIGPGNVLSNLIKRSIKGITTTQLSTSSDLGH